MTSALVTYLSHAQYLAIIMHLACNYFSEVDHDSHIIMTILWVIFKQSNQIHYSTRQNKP